jgi:hypothetical protein
MSASSCSLLGGSTLYCHARPFIVRYGNNFHRVLARIHRTSLLPLLAFTISNYKIHFCHLDKLLLAIIGALQHLHSWF